MSPSPVTLGAVNMEATDPTSLAQFWAAVLGSGPVTPGHTVFVPAAGPDGFAMFFQPLGRARRVDGPSHLDLTVPWGSRSSEVERVVALGATWQWDVLDEVPHVQWTTLRDPEGNLFCLAEHPPRA
jgi:hypothetical protein